MEREIPFALKVAINSRSDELTLHDVCFELILSGYTQEYLLKVVGAVLQTLPEEDNYDDELLGLSEMLLGHCNKEYSLVDIIKNTTPMTGEEHEAALERVFELMDLDLEGDIELTSEFEEVVKRLDKWEDLHYPFTYNLDRMKECVECDTIKSPVGLTRDALKDWLNNYSTEVDVPKFNPTKERWQEIVDKGAEILTSEGILDEEDFEEHK
jgi:hypothetical protein